MEQERADEINRELATLTEKFGLTNAAFCGIDAEGGYFGTFVDSQHMSAGELVTAAANVGRLWQFAREQVRNFLNRFERDTWNAR